MPRLIDADTEAGIELGDLIALLDQAWFDPHDEDSFAAAGPLLKRLSNNRCFLGDIAIAELRQRCANQLSVNRYGAQVIMIHQPAGKYFIRANFWPAEQDPIVIASGTAPFYYGVAHDHNFSFLTVGYGGPGYWSDYYEYDYDRVAGYAGEKVDLRFVERSRLELGKLLLYRKHLDVHRQLPPDALSVSLNIMEATPHQPWFNQYRFDTERGEIEGILSRTPTEALLALSMHFGAGAGRDIVEHFAARHPSDRVRFSAWRALASVEPDPAARMRCYERGISATNRFVSAECALALAAAERSMRWIGLVEENDP